MYRVNDFSENALFRGQFFKPFNSVSIIDLFFYNLGEIFTMLPVHLIDPYGIEEFKHQKVT